MPEARIDDRSPHGAVDYESVAASSVYNRRRLSACAVLQQHWTPAAVAGQYIF
jgi:hypothetical protein